MRTLVMFPPCSDMNRTDLTIFGSDYNVLFFLYRNVGYWIAPLSRPRCVERAV